MMDELNLKNFLPEVKAPEGFEERVLEKIREKKKGQKKYLFVIKILRRKRIVFLTAFLALLLVGLFFWPQFFKKYEKSEVLLPSVPDQFLPDRSAVLSLIEPVDFTRDFDDLPAKKVVYILEAVNESFVPEVIY